MPAPMGSKPMICHGDNIAAKTERFRLSADCSRLPGRLRGRRRRRGKADESNGEPVAALANTRPKRLGLDPTDMAQFAA
ncbi:MAG: hypothetical protein VW338_01605 [Rhodospirillaceae bacterium]